MKSPTRGVLAPFLGSLLACIWSVSSAIAIDLAGAEGLVDFDANIGFQQPRTLTILQSADRNEHLYFLIPNSIRVSEDGSGKPKSALLYSRQKTSSTSYSGHLTFLLKPVLDTQDLDSAVAEIRKRDSGARFGVPLPTSSQFYFVGPEMGFRDLKPSNGGSNPLLEESGFSIGLSSIPVRVSLIPDSYKFPIFTVGHDFSLRGVQRDQQGNTVVVERKFSTSFIINGDCALHPENTVNLENLKRGCQFASGSSALIRQIQVQLRRLKLIVGAVDGQLGPETDEAIREFQRASSLLADGIPSRELLKRLLASR